MEVKVSILLIYGELKIKNYHFIRYDKPSDFPELCNIENIFATDEDDIVYGNSNENF